VLLLGGLLNLAKHLGDFAFKGGVFEFENGAARMKDDVDRGSEKSKVSANGVAHAPLDAIAIDRFTHDLTDGKTNARGADFFTGKRGAKGEEERHLLRKLFAADLVDLLVVGVFAKTKGSGVHDRAFMSLPERRHFYVGFAEGVCNIAITGRFGLC
jgi:hypothetical protein